MRRVRVLTRTATVDGVQVGELRVEVVESDGRYSLEGSFWKGSTELTYFDGIGTGIEPPSNLDQMFTALNAAAARLISQSEAKWGVVARA